LIHDFLYWQSDDTVHSVVMTFVKMIKTLQMTLHNNYTFHDRFPYRQSWAFVHNSFLKTRPKVRSRATDML